MFLVIANKMQNQNRKILALLITAFGKFYYDCTVSTHLTLLIGSAILSKMTYDKTNFTIGELIETRVKFL